MTAPEQWLSMLASAGVPALLCTRTSGALTVLSRTPEYMGLLQVLVGRLDEGDLLARLSAAWPENAGTSPVVIAATAGLAWQCVLRAVDAPSGIHLAILRLPDGPPVPNDAFYTIVERLPDVVIEHDRQFRCVYANPAIADVTGLRAADYIGGDHSDVDPLGDYVAQLSHSAAADGFVGGAVVAAEFDCGGPHGLRHYLGRAAAELDHQGRVTSILSYIHDITELKRLQHQLELMARTDALTALLNRRGLVERIGPELDRVRRGQGELSMLMLDLDKFKSVNDRFGHLVGDQTLEAVGRILLEESGGRNFAARLGGDEFVLGLVDAQESAGVVADRLRLRISQLEPMGLDVSIGVVDAEACDDTTHLIARVDRLMYKAKGRGH